MSSIVDQKSIGRPIFLGTILVVSTTFLLVGFTFVKQLALGWLLTERDFGLFGLAVSLTVLVSSLQDTGILKLLVQRGEDLDQLQGAGHLLSALFNSVASIILVAGAVFYAKATAEPALISIVIFQVITLLIGVPVPVFKAGVLKSLDFRRVSAVNLLTGGLICIGAIVMALLGCGVYSFVVPPIFAKVVEGVCYVKFSPMKREKKLFRNAWREAKTLLKSLRWIMASGLAIAVIAKGDYFTLGLMVDVSMLGVYFFGFQLTTAFSSILTSSLSQVFMPALARIQGDNTRQANAYRTTIIALSAMSFPICWMAAILVAPFIQYVWGSKWDAAVIVAQLLLLVLPLRILPPVGRSFQEARGRWGVAAVFLYFDALGVVLAAAVGGFLGSLLAIAVCAAGWRCFVGVAQVVMMPKVLGIKIGPIFKIIGKYLLVAGVALSASLVVSEVRLDGKIYSMGAYLFAAISFLACYSMLSAFLMAPDYRLLFSRIRNYTQ